MRRILAIAILLLALPACLRVKYDRCTEVPPSPECGDAGQDGAIDAASAIDSGSDGGLDAGAEPDAGAGEDAATDTDAG